MSKTQPSHDKLSIYIPREKRKAGLIERLQKIAELQDRSMNYLVVKAILEFVEREERNYKKAR